MQQLLIHVLCSHFNLLKVEKDVSRIHIIVETIIYFRLRLTNTHSKWAARQMSYTKTWTTAYSVTPIANVHSIHLHIYKLRSEVKDTGK